MLSVRELVRSALARKILLDGADSKPEYVESPNVLTVMTMLVTFEGAKGNEVESVELFREAIKKWLPKRVYTKMMRLPWSMVVNYSMAWAVNASPPKSRKSPSSSDNGDTGENIPGERKTLSEAMSELLGENLSQRVSDFAHAYGLNPWSVMNDTPFTFFMSFVRMTERVRAQRMLDMLTVNGLPYSTEMEKDNTLNSLYEMAGIETELGTWRKKSWDERAKEGLANLMKLKSTMTGVA